MSRIRISNQFWCLFGIRCDCFANLQGIHLVEVKWIIQEIHNLKIEKQNPSEKYLLLQPASTIPMGSTYGIFTNMVSLKIKSTRWFDVTLFYIPIGGHQQPLSSGHVNSPSKKKGHELNHMVPSYFSETGNLQWDFGETVKGCYKHIELYLTTPSPTPFIHKNDVTFN